MIENLLTLLGSRLSAGVVILLVTGGLWLVSPDSVGNLAGGDLGVILAFVVVRVCATPLMVLLAAWLIVTGIDR